jgi:ABC-type antimicrobial peptide transport system permease subunit
MARLKSGSTVAGAQSEMSQIMSDLERAYPENDARGAFVEPLGEVVFGPVRPALYVLLGAVALVLLVACANVANLLLARGTSRVPEVIVRTALGARGSQLARQFMIETLVLVSIGSLAAVLLSLGSLRALLALAPSDIPRLADVAIDLRVLGATAGVAVIMGIIFGLVPVFQARRVASKAGVRSTGGPRTTADRERNRLRSVLAAVGIYGILSYSVERRTREIGIRMALGARPAEMVRAIVGQGLKLTLIGLSFGFAGAFAVTRLLATLLFGVTPVDPVTFVGVGVVLAIVALVASYVPARRATRIQPTIALRSE